MKLVLVGTRNGKPHINVPITAVVVILSCVLGVGLAFLVAAIAPEWAILTNNMRTIGFAISIAPPLVILIFVLWGLKAPPDQLAKLD